MTVQTTYAQYQDHAYAGLISDLSPHRIGSYVNISSKLVLQWDITAVNETDYFINVDGVPVEYTSDVDATEAEIQAGLVANAAAALAPFFASKLVLSANADPTKIDGQAVYKDDPLTVTQDGNLAKTVVAPAGSDMPFGRIVAFDTTDVSGNGNPAGQACKLPDASGNQLLGMSVHTHAASVKRGYRVPYSNELHNGNFSFGGADDSGYIPGEIAGIMLFGYGWVEAEEFGLVGTSPYVRYATGAGGSERGRIRGDADTNTAVQMTSALVMQERQALGISLVQFGLNF